MDKFKIIERAGEGAHGYVFKALDKTTLRILALKRITFNADNGIPKNVLREIFALRALRSKYVVELHDVIATSSGIALAMEYLPCSLADVIKNIQYFLSLSQIKCYMRMFLCGVDFIHSKHIIHRDLKPANLLISKKGLKLADFGLARIFNSSSERTYSHQVATRWYRAPELLYGSSKYTFAIDIWAVGCILAELINKQPLFHGETDIEQLAIVLSTLGTPTEENWPGLTELPDYSKISFSPTEAKSWESLVPLADFHTLDLIKSIIQYDYNKRPTAKEALIHPFFFEKPKPCHLDELPNPVEMKNAANVEMRNSASATWKDFDEAIRDDSSDF